MQLSIRDASRFVIGAAIIRDLAMNHSPKGGITFGNVVVAALRDCADGESLRASIHKLADQESAWFRSTPPHALSTERALYGRAQEIRALNNVSLAVLATLELAAKAAAGEPKAREELQGRYQAAVRAIDEMPGSTTERRGLLHALEAQGIEASGNAGLITEVLNLAQTTYLERMMTERMAVYQNPSLEHSADFDLVI